MLGINLKFSCFYPTSTESNEKIKFLWFKFLQPILRSGPTLFPLPFPPAAGLASPLAHMALPPSLAHLGVSSSSRPGQPPPLSSGHVTAVPYTVPHRPSAPWKRAIYQLPFLSNRTGAPVPSPPSLTDEALKHHHCRPLPSIDPSPPWPPNPIKRSPTHCQSSSHPRLLSSSLPMRCKRAPSQPPTVLCCRPIPPPPALR
jgi:hypothetical protein